MCLVYLSKRGENLKEALRKKLELKSVSEKTTDWKGIFKAFFGNEDSITDNAIDESLGIEIITANTDISQRDKDVLIKQLKHSDDFAKQIFSGQKKDGQKKIMSYKTGTQTKHIGNKGKQIEEDNKIIENNQIIEDKEKY